MRSTRFSTGRQATLTAVVAVLFGLAPNAASLDAQNIRGFVFSEESGGPLEGVTARLLDQEYEEIGVAITDVLGRFSFDVPGPANLTVVVEYPGYLAAPQEIEVSALPLVMTSVTIGMTSGRTDVAAEAEGDARTAFLRGKVIDFASGDGVEGAAVSEAGSGRTVLTRADGRFTYGELQPGPILVQVSRIGYQTQEWSVEVIPGSDYDAIIPLGEKVIELSGIDVTVRSRAVARRLLPIYERMERGLGGRFLTASDFQRRGYQSVGASIQGLPSVRARQAGTRWLVTFRRGVTNFEAGCDPEVWVDGIRVSRSGQYSEDFFAMNTLDVEIIELYPSPVSIPAEYGAGAMCAIGIWTKRGG